MKINTSDYLLVRLAQGGAGVLETLGDIESTWMRKQLDAVSIRSPLFVTGLARAGTTILLEELSKIPGVATHRYRDFPMLMIPCLWSRFLSRFRTRQEAVERPHKDRIKITSESPEAYEEPIWQHFFPHLHAPEAIHRLTGEKRHPGFEGFYTDHLRKILIIRQGERYLSKGNYNVTRIEYLATLFPDARFVIPVRHPLEHVHSLVRQNELFTNYDREDPRVSRYLAAAGHYEFGPQRVPIRLSEVAGNRIRDAWGNGDDYLGYAIQWAEIYRFVDQLRSRQDRLAQQILVVRYEDFCADPAGVMGQTLRHTHLEAGANFGPQAFEHISPPAPGSSRLSGEVQETIWSEVREVAAAFGYAPA
ncbi:MAG: sulfotransferase [Planctomycetales bacterium]